MADEARTGDGNDVYCDKTATTCFIENESKVSEHVTAPGMSFKYDDRYQSVKDFLAKPMMLQASAWAISDTANTDLYTVAPESLFTSVAQWQNKLYGFNLVKGTFNLRVEINAQPFQQGALLIHWYPYMSDADTLSNHQDNLIIKSQHPHVIVLTSDSVGEIQMPYISPNVMYSLNSASPGWGEAHVTVLSPLLVGAASVTDLSITIYGFWTDLTLAAPIVPQMGKNEKMVAGTPISEGLNSISKAAGSFSKVPILSPMMKPVEWVSRMASGVASVFGWSKPDNNVNSGVIAKQFNRYTATSDGSDSAPPLSVLADNSIALSSSFSITREDEMAMKYLLPIPNFLEEFQWSFADAPDTSLYGIEVAPKNLGKTIRHTVGGRYMDVKQGGPILYYGSNFRQYRGSIKFHIQLVKTQYHSGKLQFTFTPLNRATGTYTVPSITTALLSYRVVLDIKERDFVEFVCPYELSEPYLPTSESMGYLDIRVLNELRAPETCSSDVNILVFVSAGDDFEFNIPGMANFGDSGTAAYGCYPYPATLQSGASDVIYKGPISDVNIPSDVTLGYAKECVGEFVTSIKQLGLRLQKITSGDNVSAAATGRLCVYPWAFGYVRLLAGGVSLPPMYGDFYAFLVAPFRFFRGSMRVLAMSSAQQAAKGTEATEVSLTFLPSNNRPVSSLSTLTLFPVSTAITNEPSLVSGIHITDYSVSALPAKIPYWNRKPVSYTTPLDANGLVVRDYGTPLACAQFSCEVAQWQSYKLYRAIGDDFRTHFFYGVPPLYITSGIV